MAGVADIRAVTRQKLARLEAMRGEAAMQQQRRRAEYTDELRQKVEALRQATQTFLEGTRSVQEVTSIIQREQLGEYTETLRQDVKALRKDTQELLNELEAVQQTIAENQHEALVAAQDDLSNVVCALRREAQVFVSALGQARQGAASEQRGWLDEEHSALVAQVADLRDRFQQKLSQVRADLDKAHSLWVGLVAPSGQAPVASQGPAPMAAAPVATVAPAPTASTLPKPAPGLPSETPEEPLRETIASPYDDLTAIPGIGPAMQRRLHQAGIGTYAQLAASSPEFIRQSLGDIAPLAKVDGWIAAAQELISTS